MSARRRMAAAALVLMVGNVASRLLGLARETVMAWLFGATGATDAFVAASAVPTMVYDLLVGGAISAALVPVFVEAAEDRERFWRLISTVLNLAGLLLLAVAALLGLVADRLIDDVLGAGFGPEQQVAAAGMVRVMLVAVVLQGLAGVLMAALYAQNRFAMPAFAPAVYNGAIVLLALALHERLGVTSLVVGVLLGAGGQLLLQAAGLRELRYRPRLDLAQAEVRTILRLYGPVALGLLVAFAGIALDRYFASQLEAGSMTVMGYATRLIQFPLGLVGTAASLAVLPTLSAHATGMREGRSADSHLAGYRETLRFGLKLVVLLMLPAMLALVVLIEPLVRLLFEHRAFTPYDSARTTLAFLYYAPQLPLTAIDQVLIYAFYARRDTVTPVLVGVLSVGGYLVTALLTRESLGVNGLALANTVQNGSHGLILLGLLGARVGGLAPRELLGFTGRVSLAALPMAAVLWVGLVLVGPLLGETVPGLASLLGLELVVGLGVFGGLLLALRVPEARQVVELVLARWRRPSTSSG